MVANSDIIEENSTPRKSKLSHYLTFTKIRLASLVVFSAVLGYLASVEAVNWITLTALIVGGTFITGAANGLNQIYERERDEKMNRTQGRPFPQKTMSMTEGYIVCFILGLLGFLILYFYCNPLTAFLSIGSLLIYAYFYTPLKPITPLSVFVGAIPGALPPLLGFTAGENTISFMALSWFFIQFMWQFPHFWAIAWRSHEDYLKGGFYLLPLRNGKTKENASTIFFYTVMGLPVSLIPYFFGGLGIYSTIGIFLMNIIFIYFAYKLVVNKSDKAATQLMFSSFIYLPIVQILLFINF